MTMTPKPKDKLDAMTTQPAAVAVGLAGMPNGPEGETLEWHAVNWRAAEDTVRRLRQTIFTGACLSRMRGNAHVRFLGGPGAAMRPGYPAGTPEGCRRVD